MIHLELTSPFSKLQTQLKYKTLVWKQDSY